MGFTIEEAATHLGIAIATVETYELGRRKANGKRLIIPRAIALACSAIYHQIDPWGKPMHDSLKLTKR